MAIEQLVQLQLQIRLGTRMLGTGDDKQRGLARERVCGSGISARLIRLGLSHSALSAELG